MIETASISCPLCASPIEVTLDCSAGSQEFVEDCMVCCSPIVIRTECDPVTGLPLGIEAACENE